MLGENAADAEKLFAGEPETALIAAILWAFEVGTVVRQTKASGNIYHSGRKNFSFCVHAEMWVIFRNHISCLGLDFAMGLHKKPETETRLKNRVLVGRHKLFGCHRFNFLSCGESESFIVDLAVFFQGLGPPNPNHLRLDFDLIL